MKLQFTLNKLKDHHSNKSFRLLLKLLTILKFYTSNITSSNNAGINKLLHGSNDSDHIIIKFYQDKIYLTTTPLNGDTGDPNPVNTLNVKLNIKNFFQDYKLSTQSSSNEQNLVIIKINLKNLLNILKRYDQLISYKNNNYTYTNHMGGTELSGKGLVGLRLGENVPNLTVTEGINTNINNENRNGTEFMNDMLRLNNIRKQQTSTGKRCALYGDLTFKLIKVPQSWNISAENLNNNINGLGSLNVFYSEYVLTNAKEPSGNSKNNIDGLKRDRQGFQITNNPNDMNNNYNGVPEPELPTDGDNRLKAKYTLVTHDFQIPIRLVSLNNEYKYRLENINSLLSYSSVNRRIYALPVFSNTGFFNDFNSPLKNSESTDIRNEGVNFNYFLKRSLRFDAKFGLLLKFQLEHDVLERDFESYRLLSTSQYGYQSLDNSDNDQSCESAKFKILINDFKKPQESNFHIEVNWNKSVSCLKIDASDTKQTTLESSRKPNVLEIDGLSESSFRESRPEVRHKITQNDISEIEESQFYKSYATDESGKGTSFRNISFNYKNNKVNPQHLQFDNIGESEEEDNVSSSEASMEQSKDSNFLGDRILITNNDWKIFQKCYEILTNCQMYALIGKVPNDQGKFLLINTVVPIDDDWNNNYGDNDPESCKLMEFHFCIRGI